MTVRRHRGRGEGPRDVRAFERTRERAKHSAQARRAGQVQRAGRRPEGKRSAQAEGLRSQPHAVEEPPAGVGEALQAPRSGPAGRMAPSRYDLGATSECNL